MRIELINKQIVIDGEHNVGYSPLMVCCFGNFIKNLLEDSKEIIIVKDFIFNYNKKFLTIGEQMETLTNAFCDIEV